MVSHTASVEARRRANAKWNATHKEYLLNTMRVKYYENDEARLQKLAKNKQKTYEEGTIMFVRRLFITK